MKALEIQDQKLVMTNRPLPKVMKGHVLVHVHAAGINRPDLLQRKGLYPPPPGITDIPGLEIAGDIIAVGADVKLKTGQKVCALVSGGGYAEYCTVPAVQCLPMPHGLSYAEAACLPETFFTVWTNLIDRGNLKKGETILIHGGASGIGTTAIQTARALGARVFVTIGSDKKSTVCKKLGAHHVINYKKRDFVEDILHHTKNKGIDVVLDMVGGDYIPRNLKCLKTGGRHVSIAMQRGRTAELDIFQVMSKRLILTGSTLRARSIADKGDIAKALLKNIWPLIEKKKIKPVIDKTFSLQNAQKAHDYLEAGNHVGKIVLLL